MKALQVARRELIAQRNVFIGGVVLGLLSLAAPLLPAAIQAMRKPEDLPWAAASAAFAFCVLGFASVLGASLFAPDLHSQRVSFYLSLPISEADLLVGKLLGALGVTLGGALLAGLPASIWALWRYQSELPEVRMLMQALLIATLAALLILLLAHAISTSLRALRGWTLLDAIAFPVFLISVYRLLWLWPFSLRMPIALMLMGGMVAGLLLATWLQLRQGRSQWRRGHGWMSITLALSGALLIVGGLIGTDRYLSPDLGTLPWVQVDQVPERGDWVVMSGPHPRMNLDYWCHGLLNVKTGSQLRTGTTSLLISSNGQRLVGLKENADRMISDVLVGDLAQDKPRLKSLGLHLGIYSNACAVSPQGHWLAVMDQGERLWVVDLTRGILQSRIETPFGNAWTFPTFLDENVIRLNSFVGRGMGAAQIAEVDLRTDRLKCTGHMEAGRIDGWDPRSDTSILRKGGEMTPSFQFLDGRTGALKGETSSALNTNTCLLSGARVALMDLDADRQPVLRFCDLQGGTTQTLACQIPLDHLLQVRVVAGTRAGTVRISCLYGSGTMARDSRLFDVNLETHQVTPIEPSSFRLIRSPSVFSAEPGSVASRLYRTAKGDLAIEESGGRERVLLRTRVN